MEEKGSTRRSSQEMYPIIEAYKSSGQTQRDFCTARGINAGVFHYWLSRYRGEQASMGVGFEEIAPPAIGAAEAGIVLEYPNGIRVRLGSGTSASYVRSLLEVKV